MNLISDPWIPVRRANGSVEKIAPWQVTDGIAENQRRILSIASPRPDFDGALVQFLIGLLQTSYSPPDRVSWRKWRKAAPSCNELRQRFAPYARAFVLNGKRLPLFMQERLIGTDRAKKHPVSYLLIGSPTDNTAKENIDHFQKRSREDDYFCPACAGAALYTLQTFAPGGGSGGEGKFTGLRGGGPLTTLVLGESLWETVWLNVVVGGPFSVKPRSSEVFPWLDPSKFLSAAAPVRTVHSSDMGAEHVFWAMPRRIQLEFATNTGTQQCAACGNHADMACMHYFDMTGGLTYQQRISSSQKKPSWISPRHPLSPYNEGEDKRPSAVHPRPGGIGYRHWLGLIENSTEGNRRRLPASAIEQFRTLAREDGRLWAFGYEMDNMKARCWYDATMPVLNLEGEQEPIFSAHLANMVKAARYVSGLVVSAVLKATIAKAKSKTAQRIVWEWPKGFLGRLKRSPTERAEVITARVNESGEELESRVESGLLTRPLTARADFWAATEAVFFARAVELRNKLQAGGDESDVLRRWRSDMIGAARLVFRNHTQVGDFDASDPRRTALAEFELDDRMDGPWLCGLLGLP
jgi:CRISPR system Cascade subunit CasA